VTPVVKQHQAMFKEILYSLFIWVKKKFGWGNFILMLFAVIKIFF